MQDSVASDARVFARKVGWGKKGEGVMSDYVQGQDVQQSFFVGRTGGREVLGYFSLGNYTQGGGPQGTGRVSIDHRRIIGGGLATKRRCGWRGGLCPKSVGPYSSRGEIVVQQAGKRIAEKGKSRHDRLA